MTIEEYKKLTAKPPKYRNRKTDGYASAKEANRAAELHLLQRAGVIQDLREQVKYELIPAQRDENGKLIERAVSYIADFVYRNGGELVVEDTKGVRTKEYVIKRKLMLERYGIRITEV